MNAKADVSISHHGSICLVSALSDSAKAWVDEHVYLEDWQFIGAGLTFACEPRYVGDLVAGMESDGLLVN